MAQIFLQIFNMSVSASYLVLAVLLLRLLLKKAPKWLTTVLWGFVALRLICPFPIESVLSLIPSAQVVSPNIMTEEMPAIHTGISAANSILNPIISESFAPRPGVSVNPLQILVPVCAAVWLAGALALLVYTMISYIRLKRTVATAVLYQDNIYQTEKVSSPFVLGIIKPKIYLPFRMSEQDVQQVVAHEKAHIRRKDHLWKPLGFGLLALYWFNPLMWVGYILLCRDIELACDEKVIKALNEDARANYSQALLACSVNRRRIAACPLAFGEVGVKERVKTVLNYKKPAFWLIGVSLIACVAVAVCFLTNPKGKVYGETDASKLTVMQNALKKQYPSFFGLDATNGLDIYVSQMAPGSYSFTLLPHSEEPYNMMELYELPRTGTEQMRVILSTYDVDAEDVYIVPWQNPISSYLGEYWIILNGEDPEKRRAEYRQKIKDMLFSDEAPESISATIASAKFDIDGDGQKDYCDLRLGWTSGRYSFEFVVRDLNTGGLKYDTVFYSPVYDLSFCEGEDGITRVKGITQGENPEIHYYDISIQDGQVRLTKDGVPINDGAEN